MTRRLEAGPLLVTLGALLLLVSLFLEWFTGDVTAWQAFEVWDLVLFVLALAAAVAGLGLATQEAELIDRRFLPGIVGAVVVIVAAQIIDPPPAAAGQDPDIGAWMALGGALVMCAGAVLTFGRVHLALTVEGRDTRQRVSAVDARGPQDPTTESHPVVAPAEQGESAGARSAERSESLGGRLFGRDRQPKPEADTTPGPAPAPGPGARTSGRVRAAKRKAAPEAGTEPEEAKQD
jgi:hypothetical protein